jgi:membrane-associated phospholipid phosphatase
MRLVSVSKLVHVAACAVATVTLTVTAAGASVTRAAAAPASAASPAGWKPWLLTSARQFRLEAPPAARSKQTRTELAELLQLQKKRAGAAAQDAIARWVEQPAVVPWVQLAVTQIQNSKPAPAAAARDIALLGAGMYDAMIAAEESHAFYARSSRRAPWQVDRRLKPAVKTSGGSTYAPDDAAVAGAAEKILQYLFPDEPKRTFTDLADEALQARLYAGLNYRSDLERARALGQQVAKLAIARGEHDGHTSTGYTEGPFTGEQYWVRTPLSPSETWDPTPPSAGATGSAVGKWKPWLLRNPKALASTVPAPLAYESPPFLAQVRTVLQTSTSLNETQRVLAEVWDDGSGTATPAGHWEQLTLQVIKSAKLDGPNALRIVSYVGVAAYDAAVSSFALAYHYWKVRPITAIWRLTTGGALDTDAKCEAAPAHCPNRDKWYALRTTPQYPGYPSPHATIAGAAAKVLGSFFPKTAKALNGFADDVATSRVYAGVEFPEDGTRGLALGRAVANLYVKRARADA